MDLDLTFWLVLLGIMAVVCVSVALFVQRGGSSAASLRPPAHTPALNKIEMIKRYREQYGVSLAEAKEAVEAELLREAQASRERGPRGS